MLWFICKDLHFLDLSGNQFLLSDLKFNSSEFPKTFSAARCEWKVDDTAAVGLENMFKYGELVKSNSE
eukprot:TRINITY_DN12791_c0_g1_i1.p1 TRINITY_DN12791_c0_g1~~TRINITY_DN12791_c0_g1_i1.p1  ORF type:complete len:68 (-),score=8.11 TRINITY_DN12791_c0_g1_i1:178-381(-)